MARPAAVLLDFDGTLIDNSVVPLAVERACRSIAGALDNLDAASLLRANTAAWTDYWPDAERRCWLGQLDVFDVSREVWRRALSACGHDDASTVAWAFETHQRIGREMDRLFSDVDGFLSSVQQSGIPTALVTNASVRSQLARIESVGLESSFDAVVISGEIGIAKPDRAIFDVARDRVQATEGEVWHVGDSVSTDVAGALAAGIKSVWLNRSGHERGRSDPRPTLEVATLDGLHELILGS